MYLYYLIFGYITVHISDEDRATAASALLRRGLSAKIDIKCNLRIPFFKRKRFFNALKNIPYSIVSSGGLPVALLNNKHRYGLIAGLAVALSLYIITSLFVWDIRVSGNEKISDAVILDELSNIGFDVGSRWSSLSLGEVEGELLESSDNVGWININRRGGVAYVTVKEKTVYKSEEENVSYSNIVAACDCVIEELTVRSGVACVAAGDTVKRGDLLISGIIPGELGGGFVRADGDIYGRVSEEITVEVERNEEVASYGKEELIAEKLKIFKFRINIFKKYRKIDNTCVIIEDVKECTLFGKYRIPITLERTYAAKKTESIKSYTDSELTSVASARLAEMRFIRLSDAELLKMRTEGKYTDSGYKMTSQVTVLRNVGETKVFG